MSLTTRTTIRVSSDDYREDGRIRRTLSRLALAVASTEGDASGLKVESVKRSYGEGRVALSVAVTKKEY